MRDYGYIDDTELYHLSLAYGQPEILRIDLEGDEYLFSTRLHRSRHKRGEVVLAIERPGQCVLLNRKSWYEAGVYRLLSGTIEWEEGEIRWFVGDLHYATQRSWYSDAGAYPAPFDERFHLLLNVAVGGNWPGPPNADTTFPQTMMVDYVRVYECSLDPETGHGCRTSEPSVVPLEGMEGP